MWLGMVSIVVAVVFGCLFLWLYYPKLEHPGWQHRPAPAPTIAYPRHPPKPEWVRKEIIRLKALMPHTGCRTLALTFNRLYAVKRQMTVGKTFVCCTIRKHQYDIQVLRRQLKHKRPRPMSKHVIWGVDLTYLTDAHEQPHPVLGIVDHGSRVCLRLEVLQTKASIALLRGLCDVIDKLGSMKPEIIRTDNEAVFTSRLFRWGLWLLGIKHQRTEVCCPWQNGRIERFFGTLKATTNDLVFASRDILQQELATFRFWYNHIRPHQYLDGLTPFEAYHGLPGQSHHKHTPPYWFEAWDGHLTGFWLKPG